MLSNHSPEVSSTHSYPNANCTENCSSSPSRKKPISPKLRRSPSKPAPPSCDKETLHKRKNNCSEKIAEKIKRTTNGIDSISTNSKDSKKHHTENNSDYIASKNYFPRTNASSYTVMLNLTPEIGSIEEGKRLFGVLVKPIPVTNFMEKYWEQQPFRVERKCPGFYRDLLSSEAIDKMLRQNHVEFTKNIDIQFKDGNEIITPIGRALPPTIWQYYR